jgi:2'-5' RNA ligase
MARRRLGVALLLDQPLFDEVQGIRRALGDPTLGRIDPHLTLVPPVNVRGDELHEALRVLRVAAARCARPLVLTLGRVATFLPANPVAYLPVGGDVEALRSLRDDVFRPPFERSLSWPWVPHVTVADGLAEERVRQAESLLQHFSGVAEIDRVVLLEETGGRIWDPIADVVLARPSVVGTGGLALEITSGTIVDPEVRTLVEEAVGETRPLPHPRPRQSRSGVPSSSPGPIVHAARRDGAAVGVAVAWLGPDGPHVAVLVTAPVRRQGVGSHLLHSVEAAADRAGWRFRELQAHGLPEFYAARSAWSVVSSR